jgi:hypothetical protein
MVYVQILSVYDRELEHMCRPTGLLDHVSATVPTKTSVSMDTVYNRNNRAIDRDPQTERLMLQIYNRTPMAGEYLNNPRYLYMSENESHSISK